MIGCLRYRTSCVCVIAPSVPVSRPRAARRPARGGEAAPAALWARWGRALKMFEASQARDPDSTTKGVVSNQKGTHARRLRTPVCGGGWSAAMSAAAVLLSQLLT